jgi:UDP-N-acetylglucosamine 4,6-dehydratase
LFEREDEETMDWKNSVVLITGGTGSFGRKFVEVMLKKYKPKKLIVFSRDEFKQHQMQSEFSHPSMRYFVGDVRDEGRLRRAFGGVDVVVHAAALQQIPSCEYNPFEAVMTNVFGAKNVIDVAIDCGIKKVMAISTDKAVSPINLYGATKLCAEKMFVQGNSYAGMRHTRFSCVRYGNVIESRGSVITVFKQQRPSRVLTITDKEMTRFWISLEQGVEFVVRSIEVMKGGEIFVPKLPSMRVLELAKAIGPECKLRYIGIRPGEKLHEVLISEDEAPHAVEFRDKYIIEPMGPQWSWEPIRGGKRLARGFKYSSDRNTWWLSAKEMRAMFS